MKIYIAGPITNILDYKANFAKAERKITKMGHIAINPATLPPGLKDYMPTCKAMIDQADAIYLLKGWENSVGAREEWEYAIDKKMQIICEIKPLATACEGYCKDCTIQTRCIERRNTIGQTNADANRVNNKSYN